MTVLEVIQKSAEFLAKKEVDSPRLQAELLLAHVLQLPRMKLYLNFERQLTSAEEDAARELVRRRGQREPVQHILGSTSFCGFEIAVNRHVLVPRPETELLAELGWQFLASLQNSLSAQPSPGRTALDFGTGSGCIAIALAAKCPSVEVAALDVSDEALTVAKQNAAKNGVTERIRFLEGDGFAALVDSPGRSRSAMMRARSRSEVQFDLIVSNPPYIPSGEIASLQPEVRDFDPRKALDGGGDGLDFYRKLAAEAMPFLKPEGKIMLEFGDGQAGAIGQIFIGQKWIVESVREDYSRRPRILIARRA